MIDAREVFEFDQEWAHARRYAEALAGDVIAYRAALQGAGITDPLLSTLTSQFNASWLPGDDADVTLDLLMLLGGDE